MVLVLPGSIGSRYSPLTKNTAIPWTSEPVQCTSGSMPTPVPGEIKELLFRAAKRTRTKVTPIANQPLRTPALRLYSMRAGPAGLNVADRRIIELVKPGHCD